MVSPLFVVEDRAQVGDEGKPQPLGPGQRRRSLDDAPKRAAADDLSRNLRERLGNQVRLLLAVAAGSEAQEKQPLISAKGLKWGQAKRLD